MHAVYLYLQDSMSLIMCNLDNNGQFFASELAAVAIPTTRVQGSVQTWTQTALQSDPGI